MRSGPALAVAAAVVALAGCGERRGDLVHTSPVPVGSGGPAPAGNVAAIVPASLVEYRIVAEPRVRRAGRIAFEATNDGQAGHALAVNGPAGPVRTPALPPGSRATIIVRLPPGIYKWYCPIADNERRGMVGRVRIAE